MRTLPLLLASLALSPSSPGQEAGAAESAERLPNLILVYADDLGYGDLGCFGSTKNRTPHLDKMAAEGMRLTSFYSTSGVCTPSRSSLMTGCYPRRTNMHVDASGRWVLFPSARKGLHPDEVTVAEVLKQRGYQTMCIGKWHLGDQPEFLPTRQGFDRYFGIPYSNDMGRKIPLPLMRNDEVIEAPVAQPDLTRRYTGAAVEFIASNRDRPFFLYLPHTFPHLPLFASEDFMGKSANGRYGDAVEEIDWSMGRIFAALKENGIDRHTLVVFTSDNGSNGRNGGSNAPLRGRKGSTLEGGMRVPCIVRWPGRVPAGRTCDAITATLDILPTFAGLAKAPPPADRKLDGGDIWPLLSGTEGAASPREAFYYYHMADLQAVRAGKWKLVFPRKQGEKQLPLQLFDLEADIHEDRNLAGSFPPVVARLTALGNLARADLGDGDKPGSGQRPAGLVEKATPRLLVK